MATKKRLFMLTILLAFSWLMLSGFDIQKDEYGKNSSVGDETALKLTADQMSKRISMNASYIVWIREDGTVEATGENKFGQCDVEDWTDIIRIVISAGHAVGLKSDGTVVTTGLMDNSRNNISKWKDVVDISASPGFTVGVRSDGTVVSEGSNFGNCDFENWKDIVSVSSAFDYTVGLKKDGTVVITGEIEDSRGLKDVLQWKDIVEISAGPRAIAGLKSNGDVVTTRDPIIQGANKWSDIVGISVGFAHMAGVKSDGSVLIASGEYEAFGGTLEVPGERDVVTLAVNENYETAMLHCDGTISILKSGEINLASFFNSTVAERGAEQADTFVDSSDIVDEGSAGKTIHWMLTEDGTLRFSGSGSMDDCKWDYENQKVIQPWDMYHDVIEEVVIENGITNIGECALRECRKIKKIELPGSITDIGWCAFLECSALTEFVVAQDNPFFTAVDGVLFDKQMKTLVMYPPEKESNEYTVPDSVMRIMKLSSGHLQKVVFPDSVTSIDGSAFVNCDELTEIILPKNLEFMDICLFSSADSLRSIIIPKSIKYISREAIFICNNLKDVYYEGSEEDWNKIIIDPDNMDLFNATLHFSAEEAISAYEHESDSDQVSMGETQNSSSGDKGLEWADDSTDRAIKIMQGSHDLNDLVSENIKPSMYVGDSITLHAEVSSKEVSDKKVEWSLSDGGQKSLFYVINRDDSITITCVSAEMESVQITARCGGESATITIYPRMYQ